jgi:gliding motility-associated-like protein
VLRSLFLFSCFLLAQFNVFGQYISRSEPVPYTCPTICASGTITLKIPQIQNLSVGSQVQALLSNAAGSFATGTQVLPMAQYSTNSGTTWQNGPYNYIGNVNDLYVRVTIPAATPAGNNYTIKIQASTGYISNDLFQCSNSNYITVTALTTPLAAVSQTNSGNGNWIGHVYTWTPTTGSVLTTPALIAAQDFFNTNNYQGHIIYNNLPFDINYNNVGGVPGTWNDGTSMGCGTSYTSNFSVRMLRTENFSPGYYQFTIQGDDGIRFSLDGGITWILDSFIEQTYASSYKTTATANPNGICLSGPTDLVVEYFQRPLDARMTFTYNLQSSIATTQPLDLSLCETQNGSMNVGSAVAGITYQWQVSTNGGTSFTNLSNNVTYNGVTSSTLAFTNVSASLDGNLYQCLISGPCGQNVPSNSASISVQSSPIITSQPSDQAYCNGQTMGFTVAASGSGLSYQWQVSTNGGVSFTNVPASSPYSFTTSAALTIVSPPASFVGYQYQCIITGCGTQVISIPAEILPGANTNITQQPVPMTVCQGQAASFTVVATGGNSFQWQVDSGSGFNNVNNNNGYSNAQTATLNLIGAATSVNGLVYRCIISGGCGGNVTTTTALLTVNPNTAVTTQPSNQTICEGQNASFTFNANGSGLTYQWQLSSDGGATFSAVTNSAPYSGVTTGTLSIASPANTLTGNQYQCNINGVCGTAQTTNAVTLTISSAPAIIQNPIDAIACEGEMVSLTADISGNAQYQWQISTDGGATFSYLSNGNGYSGVGTSSLTINPLTSNLNNTVYQVTGTACNTTVTSTSAVLTVNSLPTVSISQVPPPVCPGETVSISAQVNDASSMQWQIFTNGIWVDVSNSSTYQGSTTSTLNIQNIPSSLQNANFRLEINGGCGNPVYSSEVLLYLNGIPVIISSPDDQILCSGSSLILPVVVSGDGISYQWQQKTEDNTYIDLEESTYLSGTTSPNLLVQTTSELNGMVIRCLLSGCGSNVATDTLKLIIYQNDPVFIPNAFTPDTDPINARFKLFTIGEPKVDAMIYDRWGELLYRWTKVEDGWDGTYLGRAAQEGIYVYKIKVTTACEQHTSMGTFQLIR